uniref:Uncharacterized protein n=1 Tax=Brassica oleracea TaxID=3712 RepID=A0A3P6HBG9_BRAOL|nr:unnamed protein product [Brassica oleracea]
MNKCLNQSMLLLWGVYNYRGMFSTDSYSTVRGGLIS